VALAYSEKLRTPSELGAYLGLRYARLAPLYSLVCLWPVATGLAFNSLPADVWPKLLLNVTFLFGLAEPGATSLVTGGWSLGIEFLFYLIFPLVMALVRSAARPWVVLLAVLIQVTHVQMTVKGDLVANWVHYTHFASFVGYFVVGVAIGYMRLQREERTSSPLHWLAWLASLGLLAAGSAETDAATLAGPRGIGLTLTCFVLVLLSSYVAVPRWLRPISTLFGEASYGLYLLHPLIFGVLSNRRLFKATAEASPVGFTLISLSVSFIAAVLVYRVLERPILMAVKKRLTCEAPHSTGS